MEKLPPHDIHPGRDEPGEWLDPVKRPTLDISREDLDAVAACLAARREDREEFVRDPEGYLNRHDIPVRGGRLADLTPPPPTSEVCTANAACNVNAAVNVNASVNVNAATKVNAVSAVNAAVTANATAFVNFMAIHRAVVYNKVRFWGEPHSLRVLFASGASLGGPDQVV
jgi:hypothetical protein